MKKNKSKLLSAIAVILVLIYMILPSPAEKTDGPDIPGPSGQSVTDTGNPSSATTDALLDEGGYYYTKEDVALYLSQYGRLPDNFITKSEAYDLGWDSDEGNLWEVARGMVIGGDSFGNREGILPKGSGVRYRECDVNYNGGYRGAERIVYSSDGKIYYTGDHYGSFELIGTFEVKK